jgi:hypothetical protein
MQKHSPGDFVVCPVIRVNTASTFDTPPATPHRQTSIHYREICRYGAAHAFNTSRSQTVPAFVREEHGKAKG